jgi:hypothetical protein
VTGIPQEKLNKLLADCVIEGERRYDAGQQKYGPNTYLNIDTLQHAIDEVVDLFNYARFTYVKLRLLQEGLVNSLREDGQVTYPMGKVATPIGPEMPGKQPPRNGWPGYDYDTAMEDQS